MAKNSTYLVRVKRGHPTGTYHRGGHVFSTEADAEFTEDQLTEEIRSDPWLIVRDAKETPEEAESAARRQQREDEAAAGGALVSQDVEALRRELAETTEALSKREDELIEANKRIEALEAGATAKDAEKQAAEAVKVEPLYCIIDDCADAKNHRGFTGFESFEALEAHALREHDMVAQRSGDAIIYAAKPAQA